MTISAGTRTGPRDLLHELVPVVASRIKIDMAGRAQSVQTDFGAAGKFPVQPEVQRAVLVAVAIRFIQRSPELDHRLTRIESARRKAAGGKVVACVAARAGYACGGLPRMVGAGGNGGARLRRTGALTGKNLNHTPDGIGTVEGGTGPAHDLDALDLGERQELPGNSPFVAAPILVPSTSTSTWPELVPRMNTEVSLPLPPCVVRSRPGIPRRSSGKVFTCWRSMSSRVITVTAASEASTVCEVRVAVTTIGG